MNTKALRQKILDLAIHGKLVPQDPNDEPASVLLERIRDEKERLIKEGKIKRPKKTKTTSDKPHYPYELPKGWAWTTINDIYFVTKLAGFEYTEYFTKDAISPTNTVPIVRAQNVKMGHFIENKNEAITLDLSKQLTRSALYKDCLLMTFIGAGIGETCIFHANKRNHLAPNVAKIEPFDEHINMEYALFFFMSSSGQLGVTKISKSTAQASLSMATIRELVIPVPPIKEQDRIANEITKWFSLVDCIEDNKENLQNTIKQTKSKILNLAIHGKLVPQDPTDEPAAELLKRINPKAEITCDNGHYQKLPEGWCETTLKHIITIKSGHPINVRNCMQGHYPIYGGNGITGYTVDYNIKEPTIVIGRVGFYCGSVYLVKEKAWVSDNAFTITIHKDIFYKKYLYYLIQFLNLRKYSNSTAQPVISGKTIYPIHVIIPPINEQHRIVAKIEEIFAQLDAIEASL